MRSVAILLVFARFLSYLRVISTISEWFWRLKIDWIKPKKCGLDYCKWLVGKPAVTITCRSQPPLPPEIFSSTKQSRRVFKAVNIVDLTRTCWSYGCAWNFLIKTRNLMALWSVLINLRIASCGTASGLLGSWDGEHLKKFNQQKSWGNFIENDRYRWYRSPEHGIFWSSEVGALKAFIWGFAFFI